MFIIHLLVMRNSVQISIRRISCIRGCVLGRERVRVYCVRFFNDETEKQIVQWRTMRQI